MEKLDQILDSLYDRVIEPMEAKEQLLDLFDVSGSASFDDVKRIWNAAENYLMHEIGEICKGDAAYCEDVPDLETYFERHYR
jgi:hypothetical protein